MQTPSVAILGATGLVGRTMAKILEERDFPVGELRPLASARSAGTTMHFRGREFTIQEATPDAFRGVDLVLSSAGASVSRALLPAAAAHGAVSIDNTSAFRMEPDIPLVVPEVNPHRISEYGERRIIANPNCSTIQLVVALKPLHEAFGVKRVITSTYQSVSGAGQAAVDELRRTTGDVLAGGSGETDVFPSTIAFNAVPHIDVFMPDDDTREEWKMRVETKKIMEAEIPLHATCVRVPVLEAHSEAVWVETERPVSPREARGLWASSPGLAVVDEPATGRYPTALDAAGRDEVLVGRVRVDPTIENGLAFWVVADNLRKGAALNAIQIAERLVS
ncbi:MAG: aspartate-semialdehyde dehydrogenase [Acidobacteriota bacterium]